MTPDRPKFRAIRMSYPEFQASRDITATARRSADRILQQARGIAEKVTADLDRREAQVNARIHEMTDDELRRFIDEQSLTASAKAMANMLYEASRIRAEFETMTPWLATLVETCVVKIIGQIDEDALIARMVAQGVSEMQADHALKLRVPGADHPRLLALAQDWPDAFMAVSVIMPDATVAEGEMVLEGAAGLIKLGLGGAMTATLANLETALRDHQSAAR
jgi:vacuolar-type H+-ATPase subunit E/Vma4